MKTKYKDIDDICGKPKGGFEKFCKDNPDPDKYLSEQKAFVKAYPLIYSLGLSVVSEPYPHIPGKQLNKALKKAKLTRKFNKYFGINTMLVRDDGDTGVYPVDNERTLRQIGGYKPSLEEWD